MFAIILCVFFSQSEFLCEILCSSVLLPVCLHVSAVNLLTHLDEPEYGSSYGIS